MNIERLQAKMKALDLEISKENITPLNGDASARQYFRIQLSQKSYILCWDHLLKENQEFSFVDTQKFFCAKGIPVPRIEKTNFIEGLILQQDLGDQTFFKVISKLDNSESIYDYYQRAIDILIKIQNIVLGAEQPIGMLQNRFDAKKFLEEIEMTFNYYFKEGIPRFNLETESKNALTDLEIICEKIASKKMYLCHRDYHSRNLMIFGNELFVIDFQDARPGIPLYDLVSLIDDCYYGVSSLNKDKLKKYYWKMFLEEKKDYESYDDFLYYYNLTLIQRTLKAVGSFAWINVNKGDSSYLEHIRPAILKIIGILDLLKEFDNLNVFLKRYMNEG